MKRILTFVLLLSTLVCVAMAIALCSSAASAVNDPNYSTDGGMTFVGEDNLLNPT